MHRQAFFDDMRDRLDTVAAIVILGCRFWAGIPAVAMSLRFSHLERRDGYLIITCTWQTRLDDVPWGAKHPGEGSLVIDQRTEEIWTNPFEPHYMGSGAIGLFLFSLPVAVPLSPVLLLINGWYSMRERHLGISRHASAFLRRVGPDLPTDIRALVTRVFKKQWDRQQRDRKFARSKPTLEETLRLFAESHCERYEEERIIQYTWDHPEQGRLTTYQRYLKTDPYDDFLEVGFSRFRGEELEELLRTYASIEHIHARD